jgi:hypothetical protein
MFRRAERFRVAVRLVAAFALLFLSFAHESAFANAPNPAVSAEYRLPDGTFADICFGAGGIDHHEGEKHVPPVCEACRLAVSILLPAPPDEGWLIQDGNWVATPTAAVAQVTVAHRGLLPPVRGPPAIS